LVISAIAIGPLVLSMRHSQDPVWLSLLIALLLGLCLPLKVWFVGEIAWRGSRSSRLHDIPLRSALIRLAAGLGLIALSRHIPTVVWEFEEEIIGDILVLAGLIMVIYALGQLLGIGMKRRDRRVRQVSPEAAPGASPGEPSA